MPNILQQDLLERTHKSDDGNYQDLVYKVTVVNVDQIITFDM